MIGAALHWLNVELWSPMWPNMFAPSLISLAAIGVSHVLHRKHADARHEDLKQHVTATAAPKEPS